MSGAMDDDVLAKPLLIAGTWERGEDQDTVDVINPATGDTIYVLSHASSEQLARAVAAADSAFRIWREMPAVDRAKILYKAAGLLRERTEPIAQSITREQGKVLREALGEVATAADVFEWYAEESRRVYGRTIPSRKAGLENIVEHEPLGVVAAFTPWNVPCLAPSKKIAAAIASGCTLVIKAAEETPSAAIEVARACMDAGLPPGVLNLVYGTPHMVSEFLIAARPVQKISFTGSQGVGRQIAGLCANVGKRCSLELGGSAPVIICEDADLDRAEAALVPAKLANAGQICVAPSRFFVHESRYGDFMRRMSARVSALRLGNGADPQTGMGPLANARRMAALETLAEDALAHGGELVATSASKPNRGFFFEAMLIGNAPDDARIMREEPFGPIVPVQSFNDIDETLDRANGPDYGLAGYAFSKSLDTARRLRRGVQVGMLGLNTCDISGPETPFGAIKGSGYGFKGGLEGLREYYNTKLIAEGC